MPPNEAEQQERPSEAWEYGYLYTLGIPIPGQTTPGQAAISITGRGISEVVDWDGSSVTLLNRFGAEGWIVNDAVYNHPPAGAPGWMVETLRQSKPGLPGASLVSANFMRRRTG